jgi:UDP-N-acetyl-D-glucosamine/UDP-N-acetyl-D-galactosamine dehydrogenase
MARSAPAPILCIVGLGYVGLPLAAAFGRTGWKTYGYDIDQIRIEELKARHDRTHELTTEQLQSTTIEYSADPAIIGKANVIIVAVPTPVDEKNEPDLTPLERASETIGKHVRKGSIVVYEATVYPGVTEDICAPILARESGLTSGKDFHVGYSPERINPGDKQHTVEKIIKIVAGQDEATTETLATVYGKIVTAGIHKAPSIKVAELAKALENTQRDINIALMNEVAMLCHKLGIRTHDVLQAAGTKWNFLPFTPGLVGGHCIGVDPYYLVRKAKDLGMTTHVISAGRAVNDGMAQVVATQILDALQKKKIAAKDASVLILGLTFKENIPDTRNAKIHDVIKQLKNAGCAVSAHDPELTKEQGEALGFRWSEIENGPFDVVVAAVSHRQYRETLSEKKIIAALKPKTGIFYDLKSTWTSKPFETSGHSYLSL